MRCNFEIEDVFDIRESSFTDSQTTSDSALRAPRNASSFIWVRSDKWTSLPFSQGDLFSYNSYDSNFVGNNPRNVQSAVFSLLLTGFKVSAGNMDWISETLFDTNTFHLLVSDLSHENVIYESLHVCTESKFICNAILAAWN